jgi:hypothetical protein
MRRLRLVTFRLLLLSPPTPSGTIRRPKALVAAQGRHITANIPVNRKDGRLEGTVSKSGNPGGRIVTVYDGRGKGAVDVFPPMAFVYI